MSQYNKNKKAVALKYDNNTVAPVIIASGLGYMAEKIIEVANQNNVPVYEDTSLATVLSQLELGSNVPEELYKAIVDIYVYFLNFNNKGSDEKTLKKPNVLTEASQKLPVDNFAHSTESPEIINTNQESVINKNNDEPLIEKENSTEIIDDDDFVEITF